ncbi:MAG: alpha/beta hydrolase-fold protein [Thermoguttaceae bacterium]|jgi:hypothetical protein
MSPRLITTVVLASVLGGTAGPGWAAGKNSEFREVPFESKELGGTVKLNMWTPPGYENDTDRRYPVIYCCQNTGRPVRELTRLFAARHYPPFLLAHIDSVPGGERENGAAWSDRINPCETLLTKTIIPWIDEIYRTVRSNKGRVLIGRSKGGGGVYHLGFKHPDLFGAIVSLDGTLKLYDGKWYEDRGEGIMQLVARNLGALRDMPILMIDGAWFGDQGVEYRKQFHQAGLRDIRVIDARYLGHGQVFDYWVPQIMTTFYNATTETIAAAPGLVPADGTFKDRVTVKITPPRPGMEVFYTTDGSDPRKKQHAAQGEVSVTVPCWLRAVAIGKDGVSKEAVARYELEGTLRPGGKPPR